MKRDITAGIDDATKCPCIGSIFVAGVAADADIIVDWKKSGVKDSKCVAPKKRDELAKLIKRTARAYVIREITPAMIDDKKVFNLNGREMFIMLKIAHLPRRKSGVSRVFVDNWEVSKYRFFERLSYVRAIKHISPDLKGIEFIPEHQADEKFTIVGAASILAKTASDKQYMAYRKQYGDFGSGSPGGPATRLFVWKHRKNPLPIIRVSWQTYKHLAKLESIQEDAIVSKRGKKILACLSQGGARKEGTNGS